MTSFGTEFPSHECKGTVSAVETGDCVQTGLNPEVSTRAVDLDVLWSHSRGSFHPARSKTLQQNQNKYKQIPLDESLLAQNAALHADVSWLDALLDSTC